MSGNPGYLILPRELEYKPVSLTQKEKSAVPGLKVSDGFALAVVVAAFVVVVSELLGTSLGASSGLSLVFGSIIAVPAAGVTIAFLDTSTKKKHIVEFERKRTQESIAAYQNDVRRASDDAKSLSTSLLRTYESSTALVDKLREQLDLSSRCLQRAESEYRANAFDPFWVAVESSAQHLSTFNNTVTALSQNAGQYYAKLNGKKHTFPAFPLNSTTIPDASFAIKEFRRIVRMGQTNFEFANIEQHRRTREVLIAGFRTLSEAVDRLGATFESSIYQLQESVSSDLAKVIEEEIKTRESLDERMLEQNRMLDNLQHNRKPAITDRPSRY